MDLENVERKIRSLVVSIQNKNPANSIKTDFAEYREIFQNGKLSEIVKLARKHFDNGNGSEENVQNFRTEIIAMYPQIENSKYLENIIRKLQNDFKFETTVPRFAVS